MRSSATFRPLISSGTVLGIGMGGFLDGIVLHQILQLHNMLSNRHFPDTVANIEINMFWDGVFHAAVWMVTLIGIAMLWRALARPESPRSVRVLVGSMFFGWGLFNAVEGIIDHQLLKLHHVVQRAPQPEQLYWDLAFLILGGAMLIFLGWWNIRAGVRDHLSKQGSGLSTS